jgi:hypothetical protein
VKLAIFDADVRDLWDLRRWAYGACMVVAVSWIPARVGFHLGIPACDTDLTLANAGRSITKVPHIVLFAVFFAGTALQFEQLTRRALLWSLLATTALGVLVELEEGASRTGNCRLMDLLPDIAGAVIAGAVLLAGARLVASRSPSGR